MQNNMSTDVVWIVFQSGRSPIGAILTGWGGNKVSA